MCLCVCVLRVRLYCVCNLLCMYVCMSMYLYVSLPHRQLPPEHIQGSTVDTKTTQPAHNIRVIGNSNKEHYNNKSYYRMYDCSFSGCISFDVLLKRKTHTQSSLTKPRFSLLYLVANKTRFNFFVSPHEQVPL